MRQSPVQKIVFLENLNLDRNALDSDKQYKDKLLFTPYRVSNSQTEPFVPFEFYSVSQIFICPWLSMLSSVLL